MQGTPLGPYPAGVLPSKGPSRCAASFAYCILPRGHPRSATDTAHSSIMTKKVQRGCICCATTPLSRSSAAMVATTRLGGGCETPGARGKQSPGHSATAVSSRGVARSGAGCRCVSDSQPAGRGRMTSPYAEKALSERAAGTKGAWTQLRSGNLSAGECSL